MLTKYVVYTACLNTIDSEGFARLYHDNVYAYFGFPRRLITDRGLVFVSQFSKALFKLEGIEGNPSTAYHPQTDGQTERNNQELEMYLRVWCSYHQTDWNWWLRSGQFHYNNMEHSSTGVSPHEAVYGQHPYDGFNPRRQVTVPAAADFSKQHEKVLEEVQSALRDAKRRMKEQYDKHVRDALPYKQHQLVWLSSKNLTTDRPSTKLEDRRFGPFKVIKKVGASAYKLAIPAPWKAKRVHDVFNESLLKPYVAPFFPSQILPMPDPPTVIDDEEHFDVEQILKTQFRGRKKDKLYVLVKWLDYSNADNQWIPIQNCSAVEKLEEYYASHPRAAGYNVWRTFIRDDES